MAIKKYIGPNRLSEIFSYIKAELDKKVTAVSGKGLSSNDYTTTEKNKLSGISSGAEVNVQANWNETNTSSDAYILHKPTSMPASDVPSWAKQPNKPSYTFSEITNKPTTIAGYGITDAKIANGTITLGSNSITPVTDVSGKADKATTLAGYGITDAKIASGVITLGSNTITPLTQHQDISGKADKSATVSTVTWSSNKLTKTINGTITDVVTAATILGNLTKAQVTTALGYTPPTTDTNTTYTLSTGDSNGQIKVTPSSGSAYNVGVKGLGSNAYSSTAYLPLAGGTMTGQIVLSSSGLATSSEAGYTLNSYGNFVHQRTEASDNLNWSNNAGTTSMRYYFETGKLYLQNDKEVLHTGNMYESYLLWGGKNFVSSYGPIDAALMDELGANRFQFIKASAITVEYSRDGGSTWTDYGASDAAKMQIFAQGGSLGIGKNDSSNKATTNPGKYMLRITIDTGTAGIYTVLNKVVVYCSTNGSSNCYCKIQKALQSTPTTFVDHTDNISIGGWSGYNVINISGLTTYGNTASSQYGRVRFIFGDGSGGNTNYNGLQIFQIKGFGGVGWNTPSTMAKTRHLYSYDESQNATFPANLYMSAGTIITPKDDSKGIRPNTNNYGEVGDASYYFYKCYCTNYYGTTSYVTNWSRNNNIGSPSTSSAASGTGLVNFYNTCAAGGTQTKTTLSVDTSVNSNITVYLPKTSGNLALAATTLAGYGITDAKIANGTITLGSNTITPLTSITSSQVTTALGYTPYNSTNPNGYITSSGSCASATKATQDGDGNTISSTYMKKGTDYVTAGQLGGTTVGSRATVEGSRNTASEAYSHAEGFETVASGLCSHSEGAHTTASGSGSHAEGRSDEEYPIIVTKATGVGSHAEGVGTLASGLASHAEGYATYSVYYEEVSSWTPTTASGIASHAEGRGTIASGNYSHSEGRETTASGSASHAEGSCTIASSSNQHVEGKYNVEDANGTYVHIIGGGSSTTRKNIFTVDWNGDVCAGRSNGLTNSTKLPTGADVIGYLVNKHYARVGSSTVSKTTDQYGQFSLSVSNGYIVACGVDYRYWVMRHGETSFRLMKQGSYAIQASTTVTVWYIYVTYSS